MGNKNAAISPKNMVRTTPKRPKMMPNKVQIMPKWPEYDPEITQKPPPK